MILSALRTESDRVGYLLTSIMWCVFVAFHYARCILSSITTHYNSILLTINSFLRRLWIYRWKTHYVCWRVIPTQLGSICINKGGVEVSLHCVTIGKSLRNVSPAVSPLRHHTTPPFNTSADFNRGASLARRKVLLLEVYEWEQTGYSDGRAQTEHFWTQWENWCVCNTVLVVTQNKKNETQIEHHVSHSTHCLELV